MLLKLSGGLLISAGAWILGKSVQENFMEKIKTIEAFVLFVENFKSAVSFSGINMYAFFEKNNEKHIKNFIDFLLKTRSMKSLKDFKSKNEVEEKCVSLIKEYFVVAENSSDAIHIANCLEEGKLKLLQYKNEFLEEYRGKMKIAPALGFITGMFIAVLII